MGCNSPGHRDRVGLDAFAHGEGSKGGARRGYCLHFKASPLHVLNLTLEEGAEKFRNRRHVDQAYLITDHRRPPSWTEAKPCFPDSTSHCSVCVRRLKRNSYCRGRIASVAYSRAFRRLRS